LPYARPAISPQFFQPCRRSRKLTDETNLTAPLIRHEVLGSRRAIRPTRTSRAQRCRVHRNPARDSDDTRSPLLVSRDGQHIRQFRISVKWNIFGPRGLTPSRVFCPSGNESPVARMEPTGRREAPPDDRLRAIRERRGRRTSGPGSGCAPSGRPITRARPAVRLPPCMHYPSCHPRGLRFTCRQLARG